MDERNSSQNFINLNIGQLLNLLDNVNKNYVRKLEKLNKSFVDNKYGISFKKICINEGLLLNYTNGYKISRSSIVDAKNSSILHDPRWFTVDAKSSSLTISS